MRFLFYTTLSASPCSAREAQGTLTQGEEGKRGNGAWTRSSCKTEQMWPLTIPHTRHQPIISTAHNISVFMEDDKVLSHLASKHNSPNWHHLQTLCILFDQWASCCSQTSSAVNWTFSSACNCNWTKLLVLFTVIITEEILLCTHLTTG